jgi:hypothetical protein
MSDRVQSLNDLRHALRRASRDEETPEDLRQLLGDSAKAIGCASRRLLRLAQWCETVEIDNEELTRDNDELEALVKFYESTQDMEGEL